MKKVKISKMGQPPRELPETVHRLIAEGKIQEATELLAQARKNAESEGDAQTLQYVLTELVGICHLSNPPAWDKAEELSRERERLFPSAYSKLQTATILHHRANDYSRAVAKLKEAISLGRVEHDDRTVYTALGLLGQASLERGHIEEAIAALSELEKMVAAKKRFVVGDETCFLESLRARRLETERVSRLASTLIPACRDTTFKNRLKALVLP